MEKITDVITRNATKLPPGYKLLQQGGMSKSIRAKATHITGYGTRFKRVVKPCKPVVRCIMPDAHG